MTTKSDNDNEPTHGPHVHTLPDGRQVALGRTESSVNHDHRTVLFRLANFIDRSKLPTLLDHIDPPESFQPRMFANDRLGDCTIAGEANSVLLTAARTGQKPPDISDQDVVGRYSKVDGYVPGDPSTDRGGVELDVLNDWRHDPFNGVELQAFAIVDVHDVELLRYAIQLFPSGVYDGIALPTTAQSQVGKLWDTVPGMVPGSWGGHCTVKCGFDYRKSVPEYLDATWGALQRLTEAFWRAVGDEAYVPLTDAALNAPGVDKAAVLAMLSQVGKVAAPPRHRRHRGDAAAAA